MRFVSIDIETTGLDRENDQVIEIGAIIEDPLNPKDFDEADKFHAIVRHERYSGSAFAINLNQRIFEILATSDSIRDDEKKVAFDTANNIVNAKDVAREFNYWLMKNMPESVSHVGSPAKILCAGKNFASFDAPFLNNLPNWTNYVKFGHRTIDPAMFYTNFLTDNSVANLETCLERAGLEPIVTHDAVQDAWDVIRVLRPKYETSDILSK